MKRGVFTGLLLALAVIGCGPKAPPGRVESSGAAPAPITNMVLIKAGSFQRGQYRITITRDFWLGKYEVTQAEFARVMLNNPSHFVGDPQRPVEKVKHSDAAAFCQRVTSAERAEGRLPAGYIYRLPTEAEWEYACRAGTTNLFSFGDDVGVADQFAWTLENSETTTHPVGQKRPNAWGLHDMHGNVWEWSSDWFEPFPRADLIDPLGPATSKFKVFRGGSWNHAVEFARSANRFMMGTNSGIHFVGFRLALGVENSPVPTNPTSR